MKRAGRCDECDEPIPYERWRLITDRPTKTCISCQENLEAAGKFRRSMMNTTIRFKGDEVESEEHSVARGG